MKRLFEAKEADKSRPLIYSELNTHRWATKMELKCRLGARAEAKPAISGAHAYTG